MKKILAAFLLLPTLCFAEARYIAATQMDQPNGSTCKVLVDEYHAGSGVMYLGECGWTGLKGIASYTQGWNYGNHIRVVRGEFSSGKPISVTKVMYLNKVNKTIHTYEQGEYSKSGIKRYNLDDVLADANQAGLRLDNSIMAYTKLANYLDVFE